MSTSARFGIARFGATRFGHYHPFLQVYINSVDRHGQIDLTSLEILDRLNQEPNEARFTIRDVLPVTGQPVKICLGNATDYTRLFTGTILQTTQRQAKAAQAIDYDVMAQDDTWWLDRGFVTAEYAGWSITDIVLDIMSRFTSGITVTHVQTGLPVVDQVPFTNVRPSTALTNLANRINGAWYLDEFRDLHFFVSEEATFASLPTINDSNVAFWSLAATTDLAQLRTRIVVEGKQTSLAIGTPGSAGTSSATPPDVDYVLVAGGGGGGTDTFGGGGGAGGFLSGTDALDLGAYAVVIGGGGAANTSGQNSTFNGHTAVAGGHGANSTDGTAGGSGGGADGNGGNGGAGTGGQGYGGGHAPIATAGGGGGGAGGPGGAGTFSVGGGGGGGAASAISGSVAYYAGGGGGNGGTGAGNGGIGGGGRGGAGGNPATAGTANTGGGGGGGDAGGGNAGAGGSGVFIASYITTSCTATGGTITTVANRTIHTFTSSGTFTITAITVPTAPTEVTDLPIDDISQLDAAGGTVRIGSQIVTYASTTGPIVTSGNNPPGSTLSADVAISATSITVADSTVFTAAPGWLDIDNQKIRYTGVGGGTINGIPSTGIGSFTATVKSGASVTWVGAIVFGSSVTFSPPQPVSTEVVQRVTVDDTTAQTAIAAIEGGDGIHTTLVQDGRLSVDGATARANAELDAFASSVLSVNYATRHPTTRSGRYVTVGLGGSTALSGAMLIRSVRITGFDALAPRKSASTKVFPIREVQAQPVRLTSHLDILSRGEDAF